MTRNFALTIICIVCIVVVIPLSCENNNELDLYGVQKCDTTNITWNSKIAALLAKNCGSCHNVDSPPNGVRHDSYAAEMIVVNDGRLRGVVNHLDGYVQMPKDRPKLPDCELKQINIWLDNGAPEN